MYLSKWREQLLENVFDEISQDSEKNVCKTITSTGDIRSLLDGSSVYRVCSNVADFLRAASISFILRDYVLELR